MLTVSSSLLLFTALVFILVLIGIVLLYTLLKNHIEKKLIEYFSGIKEKLEDIAEIRRDLQKDLQKLHLTEHLLKELGEDLRRLSQIFISRKSGKAGERGLEELLSLLPSHLLRRDLPLGDGIIEFALVIDEDKYLPIDSKFVGSDLLMKEELSSNEERELLRRVRERAKELVSYLRDERSIGFGIMACPDGLFPYLQRRIFEDLERERLLLVPYSFLLPILLFIHYFWKRYAKSYNFEEFSQSIDEFERSLSLLEKDIEKLGKELRSIETIYQRLKEHHRKLSKELNRLTNRSQSSIRSNEISE